MEKIETINRLLKLNGERAKSLAKINDTYVVYSSDEGVVREYPNGKKEIVNVKKPS